MGSVEAPPPGVALSELAPSRTLSRQASAADQSPPAGRRCGGTGGRDRVDAELARDEVADGVHGVPAGHIAARDARSRCRHQCARISLLAGRLPIGRWRRRHRRRTTMRIGDVVRRVDVRLERGVERGVVTGRELCLQSLRDGHQPERCCHSACAARTPDAAKPAPRRAAA